MKSIYLHWWMQCKIEFILLNNIINSWVHLKVNNDHTWPRARNWNDGKLQNKKTKVWMVKNQYILRECPGNSFPYSYLHEFIMWPNQVAQKVKHLTRDLEDQSLVCHYFSHPVTFDAVTNPWTSTRGKNLERWYAIFKVKIK